MDQKLARIFSVLLNPMLILTYMFILLFSMNSYFSLIIPLKIKYLILGLVFLTSFLIPVFLLIVFKRMGLVNSLSLQSSEDRTYPFLVTLVFYFITYYMLKQIQIHSIYHIVALGASILVGVAMLINFIFKISIHMTAMGGAVGAFLALSLIYQMDIPWLIIMIIICAGIVGTSRLILRAHKAQEVYAGFLLGVGLMMILFYTL